MALLALFVLALSGSVVACGSDDNPGKDSGVTGDGANGMVNVGDAKHDSVAPAEAATDAAMDTAMPDTSPDTGDTAPPTYTVGFTVIGLAQGATIVVQDNGMDSQNVMNGSFTFATPLPSGATYAVTVSMQPDGQVCTVTNGMGTIASMNVTAVLVNCTGLEFIGGVVQGLSTGATVVLQDNGGDTTTLMNNGPFAFLTGLPPGTNYAVTVSTQPTGEVCTVTNGTGVATETVTNVMVTCVPMMVTNNDASVPPPGDGGVGDAVPPSDANPPPNVTIGGTVTGLAMGATVVLQDNATTNLNITANGTFAFTVALASGSPYAVTVLTQPTTPKQTCTVAMGSGTATADVTSVAVTCTTATFTVGGTVTGLGANETLVLQDNGGSNATATANGAFTFMTPVASGASFAVTVLTQPSTPAQMCIVSAGTGMVTSANVTTVVVNCASNTYTLGGAVSGLAGGDSLMLTGSGGNSLFISANGPFAFATPLASGTMYTVAVTSNPSIPVAETCTVTNATGTIGNANVSNVLIACAPNQYTVGGTLTGLTGSVLGLLDNGMDLDVVAANGSFTFATKVTSGLPYAVTISQQPLNQTCTIKAGTAAGTIGNVNVTTVSITCVTATFSIGGTLTGLAGGNVVLQDNGGNNLMLGANGSFTFTTKLTNGSPYDATVLTNPTSPAQTCLVSAGSGTVNAANVTSITVNCATNTYTVSGTVANLASGESVSLTIGGGNNVTASTSSFAFPTPLASGTNYTITVTANPASPIVQTCTVTSGANGTITNMNVMGVVVTCVTTKFPVSVNVTGLTTQTVGVLDTLAGGVTDPHTAPEGTTPFSIQVASGAMYDVSVVTNPTGFACTIPMGTASGTIGGAGVTVTVNCAVNTFTVGGQITGLANGESVTIVDNMTDNKMLTGTTAMSQNFTFATSLTNGSTYSVTVNAATNPTSPIAQTCTVQMGTGTIMGMNVVSVIVNCANNPYSVGGTVNGLEPGDGDGSGSGDGATVTLENNVDGDMQSVSYDPNVTSPTFTFQTLVASGGTYNVTVTSQPDNPEETCTVQNGMGPVTNANVSLTVDCMDCESFGVCNEYGSCPAQTPCTTGADADSMSPIVICGTPTCLTAIVAGTSASGSYDPDDTCNALGYDFASQWGTTGGNICGINPTNSCTNVDTNGEDFNGDTGCIVEGDDDGDGEFALCGIVWWECSNDIDSFGSQPEVRQREIRARHAARLKAARGQ